MSTLKENQPAKQFTILKKVYGINKNKCVSMGLSKVEKSEIRGIPWQLLKPYFYGGKKCVVQTILRDNYKFASGR